MGLYGGKKEEFTNKIHQLKTKLLCGADDYYDLQSPGAFRNTAVYHRRKIDHKQKGFKLISNFMFSLEKPQIFSP